ncbi:hypothetical protein BU15DRAFT_74994 [Melanogaster broomeanus]|nr:hypothetical protein BU15DRAFT_74994 [Melanogaster broomeanus]
MSETKILPELDDLEEGLREQTLWFAIQRTVLQLRARFTAVVHGLSWRLDVPALRLDKLRAQVITQSEEERRVRLENAMLSQGLPFSEQGSSQEPDALVLQANLSADEIRHTMTRASNPFMDPANDLEATPGKGVPVVIGYHVTDLCIEEGKKRARENDTPPDASTIQSRASSSSLSPVPDVQSVCQAVAVPKLKKPKRAETRPCPACSELIPVRLLAAHAELELQRVEDIIRHVGDAEVLPELDDLEEGPSSKRRSALKARQSLTALQPIPRMRSTTTSASSPNNISPATIEHTITHIARRRKARYARLKELAKEEEAWLTGVDGRVEAGGVTCPVCSQRVRGDRDVVEAHVDACLAYESRRAEVERERERTTGLLRGNEDVDVDVDIDVGWGGAPRMQRKVSQSQSQLEDTTYSDEDTDKLDFAILTARSRGDHLALITALEAKLNAIPAPPTCRICLSPYSRSDSINWLLAHLLCNVLAALSRVLQSFARCVNGLRAQQT